MGNDKSGLKALILAHQICGVPYLSKCFFNNKKLNDILSKFLLLWDIMITVISLTFSILAMIFMKKIFNSLDSIVLEIMNLSSANVYVLKVFLLNLIIILRGRSITNLMICSKFNLNQVYERKVAISIGIIQYLFALILAILTVYLYNLGKASYPVFKLFYSIITHFCFIIGHTTTIGLIVYESKVISEYLTQVKKNAKLNNVLDIYKIICQVKQHTQELNNLLSLAIFIIIFSGVLVSTTCLCNLAINPGKSYSYVTTSIVEHLTSLIVMCIACNIIPKNVENFCDSIESIVTNSISKRNSLMENIHLENTIGLFRSLKNEIGFYLFGFKIGVSTLLSIISIIISYTIILVQTSQQNSEGK